MLLIPLCSFSQCNGASRKYMTVVIKVECPHHFDSFLHKTNHQYIYVCGIYLIYFISIN
jgi:hypothetical protein